MLQSEFLEKTGLYCLPETYAEIESVYNEMTINKDVFCAGFKNLENDDFSSDLWGTVQKLIKERDDLAKENKALRAEKEAEKIRHNAELKDCAKLWDKSNKEFAKNILLALGAERQAAKIYDVIEQEMGIGFIIKTKRENGVPLNEDEIDYLILKL